MSEVAPDSFMPYVGFRAWMAYKTVHGWRLSSVLHDCLWPVRTELVGKCIGMAPGRYRGARTEHVTPVERGCACGIYASDNAKAMAIYALPHLRTHLPRAAGSHSKAARVVGFVNLWGTLVECLSGAKGSHAYPESLWVLQSDTCGRPSDWEEIASDLLVYGVPVDVIKGGADRTGTILDFERLVDGKLSKQAKAV